MSLTFSDTTNKNGIIQHIERELGFEDGRITGDDLLFAQITSDVNQAVDDVTNIMNMVGGTANPDDSNHTKYPIIEADLTSGQQDYTFDEDEDGNIILDLVKVQAQPSGGSFRTLTPVNRQQPGNKADFFENGASGFPTHYDVTADGIFLWPTPNETITDGLRLFINREGSYFTVSDTTKKPGFYGTFHYYCVLFPVEKYARIHQLKNHPETLQTKLLMRSELRDHYARKTRDEKPRLNPNVESTR